MPLIEPTDHVYKKKTLLLQWRDDKQLERSSWNNGDGVGVGVSGSICKSTISKNNMYLW